MLDMNYAGEKTIHKIEFDKKSDHVVGIKGSLPAKTKGFVLSREGKKDNWDYKDYTTIYRQTDEEIQFSNDGSVYVEPVPKVSFHTNVGGTLEGETVQEVRNYEDLVIPTPVAGENYEFTGWNPEIPESGEVICDKSFTAVFVSTFPPEPEPEPMPTLEEEVTALKESVLMLENDVKAINDALGGGNDE